MSLSACRSTGTINWRSTGLSHSVCLYVFESFFYCSLVSGAVSLLVEWQMASACIKFFSGSNNTGYSTSTGERESHPFHEEPWHLHYVFSLSMHSALPTCQPPFMVRSLQLVEVRPCAKDECTTSILCCIGTRVNIHFVFTRQVAALFCHHKIIKSNWASHYVRRSLYIHLRNNTAKFHPVPNWNDGALGLF